jgi:mRNA interferase RelE/StbE
VIEVPFEIRFRPKADHFLKSADKSIFDCVVKKISRLADNPHPRALKKILGEENVFRIRVGNYRILYSVEANENVILIVNIDKRSRIYHR